MWQRSFLATTVALGGTIEDALEAMSGPLPAPSAARSAPVAGAPSFPEAVPSFPPAVPAFAAPAPSIPTAAPTNPHGSAPAAPPRGFTAPRPEGDVATLASPAAPFAVVRAAHAAGARAQNVVVVETPDAHHRGAVTLASAETAHASAIGGFDDQAAARAELDALVQRLRTPSRIARANALAEALRDIIVSVHAGAVK